MRRGPGHDRKLPRPGALPTLRPVVVAWVFSTLVVMCVAVVHDDIAWRWRSYVVVSAWGLFGAAGVFTLAWDRRRVQVERRVVELRFRACTECGYSLHDAAQEGLCPECGRNYELDRTIRAWQTWLDR